MYIGLVRHFKVDCKTQAFMSSTDFENWVSQYDNSPVISNPCRIDHICWDRCFSSDLPRAIQTAEAIFKREIIQTPFLREVPLSPLFRVRIKLPYWFWIVSGRFAWNFHHKSQTEIKEQTRKRASEFLDTLAKEDKNILVVCHGFFMRTFIQELKRRGFIGDNIQRPRNGTLYLFKKII